MPTAKFGNGCMKHRKPFGEDTKEQNLKMIVY